MAELALLLWLLPAVGALQLGLAWDNLRGFQAVPAADAPAAAAAPTAADAPAAAASLLIPARDEAKQVGACVRAALAQAAVREVWVLDDGSTDDTAALARAAGAGDPRLAVVTGIPPGPGWVGKAHACWQLAARAQGDWLVFVDADVVLAPGAVAEAIRRAEALGADLLSFWPRHTLGSPGERLLVPLVDVVLLGFLPFRLVASRQDPALAAANGQCLVFRAASYARMGGHAAVRGDMVEDVALARAMKRAGGRVALSDAGEWARVRMYDGLASAWAGFRKNLYPAFGGRPGPFLVGLGLFAALHALPPGVALAAWLVGRPEVWAPMAVQGALAIALRLLLVVRLGHPVGSALLHPVGAGLVVALGLASWRAAVRGAIVWKGRRYALEALGQGRCS